MFPRPGVTARLSHERQHVQRGRARLKSRAYYRRNRTRILTESRKRYRKIRRNPRFKRRRELYRKHPEKFRRRLAVALLPVSPGAEFWSPGFGWGVVEGVSPSGEIFVTGAGGVLSELGWEAVLEGGVFLEEEGLDRVVAALDEVFELEPDFCSASNVAARYVGPHEDPDPAQAQPRRTLPPL